MSVSALDYRARRRRHRRGRRRQAAASRRSSSRRSPPATRGAFGGFGGMFRMPDRTCRSRVLVVERGWRRHEDQGRDRGGPARHVGHDLVNHCVNDILVQGAPPLFFLDYVAFGALEPAVVESVVRGVAAGCRENGCALVGGETAEMPGVYTPPDYDLAGFIVGYVEEDRDPRSRARARRRRADRPREHGLHTNGYSLARRIVSERMRLGAARPVSGRRRVRWRTCCCASTARISRRCGRCSARFTRWRTSRAAAFRGT